MNKSSSSSYLPDDGREESRWLCVDNPVCAELFFFKEFAAKEKFVPSLPGGENGSD